MREIFRRGRRVGAIAPTSAALARNLSAAAGVPTAAKIIELGAGTGAITEWIMKTRRADSRVLAVESHPAFAAILAQRFPDLRVARACASELPALAEAAEMPRTECVISALPWTAFPVERQRTVLSAVREVLAPGGTFVTIACLGFQLTAAGQRFRRLLDETFSDVQRTPVTWRNVPPAFIYRCRAPRPSAEAGRPTSSPP